MILADYGLEEPTSLSEAMDVIAKLLDRCDQLNEIINELDGSEW